MTLASNYLENVAWHGFLNDTEEDIPAFSCVFVNRFDRHGEIVALEIIKPNAHRHPYVGFTGPWHIPKGTRGSATLETPVLAAVGANVGANVGGSLDNLRGRTVGPIDGEWSLGNASEGFTLLYSENEDTDKIVYVNRSTDDVIYGIVNTGETISTNSPGKCTVYINTGSVVKTKRVETVAMTWVGRDLKVEEGGRVLFKYEVRSQSYVLLWADCPEV